MDTLTNSKTLIIDIGTLFGQPLLLDLTRVEPQQREDFVFKSKIALSQLLSIPNTSEI